jgi:RNA polymerase sigma factor (sigma-70 family)
MPEPISSPGPDALSLLNAVTGCVARSHRLSQVDSEDFGQIVQLKFLERRYDAFTRFRGDSALETYLIVVVTRLLLDWRNATYGKWRPCAAAARLGPLGVRLDTLISRDGYTQHEAVEIVHRTTLTARAELHRLADLLPRRPTRRQVEQRQTESRAVDFRDPIELREDLARAELRSRALRRAYGRLSEEDRRLIALRYHRALSVRTISKKLQMDQRALYRRFERVLSRLRFAFDQSAMELGVAD